MIFDFLFVCLKPLMNIKYNRMETQSNILLAVCGSIRFTTAL